MKIIKVAEATNDQLNWLVAKCEQAEGRNIREGFGGTLLVVDEHDFGYPARFSTDWSQGGPIIEREDISILRVDDDYGVDHKGYCNGKQIPVWGATTGQHGTFSSYDGVYYEPQYELPELKVIRGATPLVAAMLCYVSFTLGSEAEIPETLTES